MMTNFFESIRVPNKCPSKRLATLIHGLALCFVATILAACDVQPGDHVVWSPDERTMALLAGDGLHFGDPDGKLSPVVAPNIEFFGWLPDSKHAVIVQKESLSSWSDLEKRLTPEERAIVKEESKSLRDEVMSIKHSIEELAHSKEAPLKFNDEDLVFLVSTDPEFKQKYLKLMRKAFGTDVTSLISADVHVVKLVALSWTSMILDKELFFIRKPIKEIRVAPNGKVVAIVTDIDEAFDRFRIAVVSLATNDLQVVTEAGSEYPDWSADSQNLLYFQKMWASSKESEDELPSFGALSRTRVCDDAGHLLRDKQPSEQLAVVAYSSVNRVRGTADGRIFFSCPVLKLPAARPQHSYTQGLFALDPSRFYATIPLIDQSDSNLVCQAFESSRDGKTVAIPEKNGDLPPKVGPI